MSPFNRSTLYLVQQEQIGKYADIDMRFAQEVAMGAREPLVVHAIWDDEVKVWVATSKDVPGLVTEAPSLDKLIPKLKVMIPELLDANGHADGGGDVRFKVLGEINEIAHRAVV